MLHLVITITHLSSSSSTLQLEDITLTSLENLHLSEYLQPQVDPEVFKSLKELSSAHLDNPASCNCHLVLGRHITPLTEKETGGPIGEYFKTTGLLQSLFCFPFPQTMNGMWLDMVQGGRWM
jgi:hypothetical protein